jgi:NitT/TauT family transport system substrate-binding protein
MKKSLILLGLVVLLGAAAMPSLLNKPTLKVGVHPWIGYESLYLARDFNWLPGNIELLEGGSAVASLDGIRRGELDAAALTLDEVFTARSEGVALTIVAVFDVSAGADVLMVKPGISNLNELAGARIAVEHSALGALMLAKVLTAAGLSREAVEIVNLAVDEHVAAWQAGSIDASICYQPIASKITDEGGRRLLDSGDFPDTVFDVFAVRPSVLRKSPQLITDLLSGHFKAL